MIYEFYSFAGGAKMTKSNISLTKTLCFICCLMLFVSCSGKEAPKTKSARLPTVTVTQPKVERAERIITAVGTLELEDDVYVATEVAGLVKEVKFEEGQQVNPGESLVELDPTNFKLNLEKNKIALDKAKSNLSLAEDNYNRAKTLQGKDLMSNQEYQESATALENAKSDFAGAQTNCQIAQRALDYSVIKAPVDENNKNKYTWEIQKKMVSIGEYLNTGSPVAELVNRTFLKLRFTVPERDAGYLAIDKTVKFTVPALPDKEFEAKIIYIGPEAAENTRAVIVKARFNNTERVLRAGYSANVRFLAETKEKSLVIPRRALRFDVDKPYVLIVSDDNVLHKKTVEAGIQEENTVEIISGISATDNIVVRSSSFLEDGNKVVIVEDK